MFSIIVAFTKEEDGNKIKGLLARNGMTAASVCTAGASVIGLANELDGGIVICGSHLSDMYYSELYGYLPREFQMLLMAAPAKLEDCINNDIICLAMPLKAQDLISTLRMMTYTYTRRVRKKKEARNTGVSDTGDESKQKARNEKEKEIIRQAKALLMERNNLTENEAHRYIQKSSMDNCMNMEKTALMILNIMN